MSAKFYFYPNPISNHLVSIDLGESLGELYSDWEYLSSSSTTMNGKIQTSVMLNREIITISRDRMKNGDDLYGEFMGLMNHLDRGNSCAFCADVNDNYAFPLKKLPVGGDTTIDVFGNPFLNMTGANVPTIGDYIVLETSPPDALYEVCKVSAISSGFTPANGGTITVSKPINFTYSKNVFMRNYRFWPVLKRLDTDRGKNIVTNEHALTFSLEVRLTPDYSNLFAFHPNSENDVPSSILPEGTVIEAGVIFETPSINLDNPPEMQNIEANLDIANNTSWNNWRNWGN